MGVDGADFDGAPTDGGNAGSEADGFVQIFGLNEIVSAELFFGFGEGTVGDGAFFIAHAHGGGAGDGLKFVAAEKVAALSDVIGKFAVFRADGLAFGGGQGFPVSFISIDQEKILHSFGLLLAFSRNSRTGGRFSTSLRE